MKAQPEKLFKLHNGDWIKLSGVDSIRFSKANKISESLDFPDAIIIDGNGFYQISIKFENANDAKNYMQDLAEKVNGAHSGEKS